MGNAKRIATKIVGENVHVPGYSKHMPEVDVRHPMLEMGDKLGTLMELQRGEVIMRTDEVLGTLFQGLEHAYDAVRKHLDANYRWD